MNFYEITQEFMDDAIYINPKHIEYYEYLDEDTVHIVTPSLNINIDKLDFTHMMILEDIQEY